MMTMMSRGDYHNYFARYSDDEEEGKLLLLPSSSSFLLLSSSSSYSRTLVGGLPSLTFIGFLIYAVAVSNTAGVADACGRTLWDYMLARLILCFVGSFGFVCVGGMLMLCLQSKGAIGAGIVGLLFVVYIAVMLGVGTHIVTGALASPGCVSALSEVSFTGTPLLAILGCVLSGLDGLCLLAVLCVGVFFCCAASR